MSGMWTEDGAFRAPSGRQFAVTHTPAVVPPVNVPHPSGMLVAERRGWVSLTVPPYLMGE